VGANATNKVSRHLADVALRQLLKVALLGQQRGQSLRGHQLPASI
jgi:hypothetical protein